MKKVLYLGLEVSQKFQGAEITHYPIIRIVPRDAHSEEIQASFQEIAAYTHLIFTSKSAVDIFFKFRSQFNIDLCCLLEKNFIAVGVATASSLQKHGVQSIKVASEETAEGVVQLLRTMPLDDAYLLWPCSAMARSVLTDFFHERRIKFRKCIFYDTVLHQPYSPPNLDQFDEIIFTSPSTVDAFLKIYGSFPQHANLRAIGPITQEHLMRLGGLFVNLSQ